MSTLLHVFLKTTTSIIPLDIADWLLSGKGQPMPAITVALWLEEENDWVKQNVVLSYLPPIIQYDGRIFVYQSTRRTDNYNLYREITDVYYLEKREKVKK